MPRDRTWGKREDASQRSRLPIIRRIKSGDLVYIMEKAMAPHSSTLALKILWMEEPGRLQSMESLRVGHD